MFHRLAVRALPRSCRSSSGAIATRRSTMLSRSAVPTLSLLTASRLFSTAPAPQGTISNPNMFCRQCEQTQDHVACTTVGICGKSSETSAVQDTLMHLVRSVSTWGVAARAAGASADEMRTANVWTLQAAFSTLTNVNFSQDRICEYIRQGIEVKDSLESLVKAKGGMSPTDELSLLNLTGLSNAELEDFGHSVGIPALAKRMGQEDCFSLKEIATYGAKGAAAYAAHCYQLGCLDDDIMKGLHEVYAKTGSDEADMSGLLANALKVGEVNGRILGMLDGAHNDHFGAPEPTQVKMSATKGKCILISGHDMKDLEALLKQTEGTGVNVYTHGEMLPAHGYPGLKKYPHLVGNYGTAWQNQ